MDDSALLELARAADPYPAGSPLDPAVVSRAVDRTREVVRMDTQRSHSHRRRFVVMAVAGAALVALAVGLGVTQLGGDDGTGQPGGVALAGGNATASCIQFSEEALARAPIAFDGTVRAIDGQDVTLDVNRWYRSGSGDTVTIHAPDLTGTALEGGVGFEQGGRYLVSADRFEGQIVPSICGFSVTYSDEMAATFARSFG
jgi:hypothetical protein